MTVSSVQQASLQPQFEDTEIDEVIRGLEAKAKGLSVDQRAKYLANIHSLAQQILREMRELRVSKGSGKSSGNEANRLYAKLKTVGEQFLEDCSQNDASYATYCQSMDAIEKRLRAMELHPTEFIAPPPSAGRNFDDVALQRYKMHIQEQMGGARVVAAGVEAVGAAVGALVESECNKTAMTKKACAVIEQVATDVVKGAAHNACEAFPNACRVTRDLAARWSRSNHALAHTLNEVYDIPLEEGMQYERDGTTIALALLPLPPVVKGGKNLVKLKPIVPKVTPPVLGASSGISDMGMHFRNLHMTFESHLQRFKPPAPYCPQGYLLLAGEGLDRLAPLFPKHTPKEALAHFVQEGMTFGERRIVKTDHARFNRTTGTTKPFIIVDSRGGRENIVSTALGLLYLRKRQFQHVDIPKLEAMGCNGTLWMAISDMGESLDRVMLSISRIPVTSSLRREEMQKFADVHYKTGRALADLHATDKQLFPPQHPLHEQFLSDTKKLFQGLVDQGVQHPRGLTLENIESTLRKHPVIVGLTHGDAHIGNVAYNSAKDRVGLIDFEYFLDGISTEGIPCAFPVLEYMRFLDSIELGGSIRELTKIEIKMLVDAFEKGYKSLYKDMPAEVEEICKGIWGYSE